MIIFLLNLVILQVDKLGLQVIPRLLLMNLKQILMNNIILKKQFNLVDEKEKLQQLVNMVGIYGNVTIVTAIKMIYSNGLHLIV